MLDKRARRVSRVGGISPEVWLGSDELRRSRGVSMREQNDIRAESILSNSAAIWPNQNAVIDPHGAYTYSKLYSDAQSFAHTLISKSALPGSIVGVESTKAADFLVALFGSLYAGCVAIPVAPNLSEAEKSRLLAEASINWLVRPSKDTAGDASEIVAINPSSDSPILKVFPDAALMRHTSGTTAKSKGVVLSHSATLERARVSQELLGLSNKDVLLAPLSISYHFIASALACLRAGATLIDCATLTAPEILNFGAACGATVVYASPNQYDLLVRSTTLGTIPSLLRAVSTSALLRGDIAHKFFARFGTRLTQVYGIIEVGLPIWNELESINPSALGICRLPYECDVVDELGAPVARGDIGELIIRGPGLFSGYFFGNNAGAPHLRNQWFYTGDLVTRDELGIIIYRGRKKSVINLRGNKIFPEEIEEVLKTAPEISAVRVLTEYDPSLGDFLVAEIVIGDQTKSNPDAWRRLCSRELSSYKVPVEFRVVEELPTTGSGKIVRY